LQEVSRRHDLDQFGRPPFRGQRGGQNKQGIKIVDGVHGITFEQISKTGDVIHRERARV
jgi:hypothetical protein